MIILLNITTQSMAPAANDKAYGKQLFAKPTANVPKKII
jgi:hypothetical protein